MNASAHYRVVFDTNQIISAGSRWVMSDPPTPTAGKLEQELIYCVARDYTGLVSPKMVGEYVEKLMEFEHPQERILKYIGYLLGAFETVQVTSTNCSPAPTDPDDIIFLLCAIDGSADLLISNDKHLLALRAHYAPPRIMKSSEAGAILLGVGRAARQRQCVRRVFVAWRRLKRKLNSLTPRKIYASKNKDSAQ